MKTLLVTSVPDDTDASADGCAALAEGLRQRVQGDVRFDRLSRAVYATDASIYEIVPVGVVMPKNVGDVVACLEECRTHSTSIVARGAGTGLAGGAVGPGVQLDLSRHMTRVGRLDVDARTVVVEPGVVLDELNAHLAPCGLQFAPDVATSSRATIGGMIANNSCGAHSIVYGRTVDHVRELTVVLADGRVKTFSRPNRSTDQLADQSTDRSTDQFTGRFTDRSTDQFTGRSSDGSMDCGDPACLPSPLTKGGLRGVLRSPKNLPRPLLGKEGGKRSTEEDDATQNDATQNDASQNDATQNDATQNDATQNDASQNDATQTDATQTDAAQTDAATVVSAADIESQLGRIRDACFDDIQRRFPQVLRSNGGYGLDRLGPPGTPAEAIKVLCGSEGTLGVVVSATLDLIPLPHRTGLVVLPFDDLFAALAVTPAILRHAPAAVELIDRMVLDAGRANVVIGKPCEFLQGNPDAVLIVEFHAENATELTSKMEGLSAEATAFASCQTAVQVVDKAAQEAVWNLRKAGLGLLMSKPGDEQAYAFVEDTAVDPSRLGDYIKRFAAILEAEGVSAGYYAHASVGCIHVRPVLNLKRKADVDRMRRIADAVSDLALEFGGAMTGEHGDGLLRSCWLEKMYGPKIVDAFRQVKRLFDPQNLLNPHKIVEPRPMTHHLRFGASFQSSAVKTHLDFSEHGGMAGLAGMCSGVGQCRQRLVGTMCPSYIATGDETHTTRARANALRIAMSNRELLSGMDDPALAEVMDLCIGCKACKTECPTGVDMAKLKIEYLAHRNLREGVNPRARLIAELPQRLAWASRLPRVCNLLARSKPVRTFFERRFRLDRRIAPPKLATRTFRDWFRRHAKTHPRGQFTHGPVVYFVDTWTNYFAPQVGIAAVRLLERAGYHVLCPTTGCCGRPAISQGLLVEAKQLAEINVARLAPLAASGAAIVSTEPSCLFTLTDEYPQLVRSPVARRLADRCVTIETFLRRELDRRPDALRFERPDAPLIYHAHCHQKATVGSADALALLRHVWGDRASEINSGCCGMAGAFGHEAEHYDVSRAIGEDRLFPAVRQRGDAEVAVSGFSCREQIAHHMDVKARHVVEVVEELLSAELPTGAETARATKTETGKSRC